MTFRTIFLSTATLLSACAGVRPEAKPQANAPAAAAKDGAKTAANGQQGHMVCEYEEPVGSHIPKRVCRYQPAPGENAGIDTLTGASQGFSTSQLPAPPQASPGSPSKIAPPAAI